MSARHESNTSKLYRFGYDLVSASGAVRPFGGAAWWGDTEGMSLNGHIVSMSVLVDGRGYWLAGSDGGVFSFGAALFHGSLGAKKLPPGDRIVKIIGTPDGGGYWLIDSRGVVTPFGDAHRLGALPAADVHRPIVSASVSGDGLGIWLTNNAGDVFTLGDAASFGQLAGQRLPYSITSIAKTPDEKGYWLTAANGKVYPFGDAAKQQPDGKHTGPTVGIIPAFDNLGYWVTTTFGYVSPGGDAVAKGGTNGFIEGSPIVAIAKALRTSGGLTPNPTYPSGTFGYDVNWPQCAATGSSAAGVMPGPPGYADGSMRFTVAVVGVDGWAVDGNNSCLGAEVNWARHAYNPGDPSKAPPYELYLFLNSPSSTSTIDQTGPAGTCSHFSGAQWEHCLAYNYGYNAARLAVGYASSQGAHSGLWWLDVENAACAPGIWNQSGNGEFWSCDQALNSSVIQGAIDDLRSAHIQPGIYSTSQQWRSITNNYTPSGSHVPIWIAGAYWTSPPYPASDGYYAPSANRPLCAHSGNSYAFASGSPTLLQETPGSNNYPFDPDYAC